MSAATLTPLRPRLTAAGIVRSEWVKLRSVRSTSLFGLSDVRVQFNFNYTYDQALQQVLDALRSYVGAVVLVTHDPGAAEALDPQRVVLLPDGTEDHWSEEYRDLIELA